MSSQPVGRSAALCSSTDLSLAPTRYLNTALPLAALVASLLIVLIQYARSKRRHEESERVVAQLDPTASSVHLSATQHSSSTSSTSSTPTTSTSPSLFSKVLRKFLPCNSSKILNHTNANGKSSSSKAETISAATLAVFRTENAMILNEVHSIPINHLSEAERRKKRTLDTVKEAVDTIGAVILAALHAVSWISQGGNGQVAWAATWVSSRKSDQPTATRQATDCTSDPPCYLSPTWPS